MTNQTEREAFVTIPLELALDIKEHLFCYALYLDNRDNTEDAQAVKAAQKQIQQAISAARASLQGGEKCIWRETEEMWEADCGVAWTFNDGGPKENSMKYCHVCGKEIDVDACHARKEG